MRVALGAAVLLVLAALVLDMSRSAPRTAGSDHFAPLAPVAAASAGGSICQPVDGLPSAAARARLTVPGPAPVPAIELRFTARDGRVLAEGRSAAGAAPGAVVVPLRHLRGSGEATEACLRPLAGGVTVEGEGVPVSALSERVDGQPLGGRVSIVYLRAGSESWWQLLPALDERLGLGKAPLFGPWLLPFAVLALTGVWAFTVRLLARELT